MRQKSPLGVGFLFFCILALAACRSDRKSPPDTIVTAVGAPVASLDPLFATSANAQHINQLVHLGLVEIGDDLLARPQLAESFTMPSDTEIVFNLRQGCQFHNGRPVTAKDVVKAVEFFTLEKYNSTHAPAFRVIENVEVLGEYRVKLVLRKTSPSLLDDLALMKIFPAETYDKNRFINAPVGAGPFRVVEHSTSGTVLQKFDNGCMPVPKYNRLIVKVIRDDNSKYLKLREGSLDILVNESDFRKAELVEREKPEGLHVLRDDGIAYAYLGVNFHKKELQDVRVRKALAHAFNVSEIIRYKKRGYAKPAAGLLADRNWYANKSLKPLRHNLELARKLLDEAGFYNGKNNKPVLKLSLKTTSRKTSVENAQVLVAQAKLAGIQLQHRAFEWGTFYSDVKQKNTEIYSLRWVGVTNPGHYHNIFHSKGSANRTHYHNSKVDALIEAAESTLNREKRKALYDQVQQILANDIGFISLWHDDNVVLYRDNIKNIKISPNGSWKTFWHLEKHSNEAGGK